MRPCANPSSLVRRMRLISAEEVDAIYLGRSIGLWMCGCCHAYLWHTVFSVRISTARTLLGVIQWGSVFWGRIDGDLSYQLRGLRKIGRDGCGSFSDVSFLCIRPGGWLNSGSLVMGGVSALSKRATYRLKKSILSSGWSFMTTVCFGSRVISSSRTAPPSNGCLL